MWRNLAKAFREWGRSFGENGAAYRPDLHYMRGPGPKWRAKYGNLSPKDMPSAPTSRRSMPGTAENHA